MVCAAPKAETADAALWMPVGSGGEAVLAGITPPVPAGREVDGPSLLEVGIMVLMVEFLETMMEELEAASMVNIKEVTVMIW